MHQPPFPPPPPPTSLTEKIAYSPSSAPIVSLQATDVFDTQNIIETTITPDLELRRELVYQFQRVGVNVSYKLVE